MKIQVCGSGGGCAACKTMVRNVEAAVADLGLSVEPEYVTRIQRMIELGISGSPALVVDGDVKCVGETLEVEAVKTILVAAAAKEGG